MPISFADAKDRSAEVDDMGGSTAREALGGLRIGEAQLENREDLGQEGRLILTLIRFLETLGKGKQARSTRSQAMGMSDYTPHQQGIINRYYKNLDSTLQQRLAELVGELYLSKGKKRSGVWDRIVATLQNIGIPQARIDHLRNQDDPAPLAEIVKDLEGKK